MEKKFISLEDISKEPGVTIYEVKPDTDLNFKVGDIVTFELGDEKYTNRVTAISSDGVKMEPIVDSEK